MSITQYFQNIPLVIAKPRSSGSISNIPSISHAFMPCDLCQPLLSSTFTFTSVCISALLSMLLILSSNSPIPNFPLSYSTDSQIAH